MRAGFFAWSLVLCGLAVPLVPAQPLQLPTANRALLERGGEERYFVGTTGKTWPSGTFGCVRSEGFQMHEGLDIRAIKRDRLGEPADPILAAADGTVAYINKRVSASNYGKYVVLRHVIDGLEVLTLYAHLSDFAGGLSVGKAVKAGEPIATMGRTSNTRERISKERAHVHFEINLFLNDNFSAWYKKEHPKEKDDHGIWNGQNMAGLDPRLVFLHQQAEGPRFNLLRHLQSRPELLRVMVRDTSFPFLRHYPMLIRPNPVAQKEGVAGHELVLDFNAVPMQIIPRAASEMKSRQKYHLLSVNASEQERCPCRKLVVRRGQGWELSNQAINFLDLLTQ